VVDTTILARRCHRGRPHHHSPSDVKKRVEDLGGEIKLMSPDELMAYVRQEHDKWAKVVKTAGVKAE
jgi:tripartite-type tricarboxylate transporter receptor subunit TctC